MNNKEDIDNKDNKCNINNIDIVNYNYEHKDFFNLIFFKWEIRQTMYKLLIDSYYLKYEKININLKGNIDLENFIKQYFNNIYLYLIVEKNNNMNFLIYKNDLINKYYFIACNIENNNIFIKQNQITGNHKDIICNEFIQFINKPLTKDEIENGKKISYSKFNYFYYIAENNNIVIPKITYNIIKDIQYIYCINNYYKYHFDNTIKFLENKEKK